jgi:DNA uptake protein ComE-like DNA-binding protein
MQRRYKQRLHRQPRGRGSLRGLQLKPKLVTVLSKYDSSWNGTLTQMKGAIVMKKSTPILLIVFIVLIGNIGLVMAADDTAKVDKIDINKATASQFEAVKGVSPKLAASLVEAQKSGFDDWLEVLAVKGVGQKKLELLKAKFALHPPEQGSPTTK